ncbi:hypothetical protein LLS1_28470 [Leifsonia sp. LS1]|nr:hypothetical protein LLS1_28470 [Leifsonia sp. LS1]
MKLRTMSTGIVGLVASLALAALPVVPSQASEDPTIASSRAFLASYGVDARTQNTLIETYLSGGTWDSMSSAAQPRSVVGYSAADGDYTVNTYTTDRSP